MDVYELIVFGGVMVVLMISGYYQDKRLGHLELKIAILEGNIAELQGLTRLYNRLYDKRPEFSPSQGCYGTYMTSASITASFATVPPKIEEAE